MKSYSYIITHLSIPRESIAIVIICPNFYHESSKRCACFFVERRGFCDHAFRSPNLTLQFVHSIACDLDLTTFAPRRGTRRLHALLVCAPPYLIPFRYRAYIRASRDTTGTPQNIGVGFCDGARYDSRRVYDLP